MEFRVLSTKFSTLSIKYIPVSSSKCDAPVQIISSAYFG